MNRMVKKRQTLFVAVAFIIISYLLFRFRTYTYETTVVIPKVHPSNVWEFVADFSNMKYLNPTLVDFNILSDTGNYQHWKYSTEYTEHLSHWPYLKNTALAHYNVKTGPHNVYYIISNHNTCMLEGLLCLESESEFKFSLNDGVYGARCTETVRYQCPFLFAPFCRREVKYQRASIFHNLMIHFDKK
ncbi:hypothetical protein FQR65_LT12096 [Abscondita terminalis]|nr:hypothetical protein FQR65_LT12096 [Abscondita terminalis]